MVKKIVIISGKKQTGKDTLAELFVKNGYTRLAFADQLKQQTLLLINNVLVPEKQLVIKDFFENKEMTVKMKALPHTPEKATVRRWLQRYSVLIKEVLGIHYWADVLVNEVKEKYMDKNIVISDARFPYEIDRVYDKLGAYYDIYLMRIHKETVFTDNDESETALDDVSVEEFDYIIDNNKELKDLATEFGKIYVDINKNICSD